MRTSRCFFNSAAALHKVFVSNATALEAAGKLHRLLLPAMPAPFASSRPFSPQRVCQVRWGKPQPRKEPAADEAKGRLRDYGIVFPWIQLRHSDGTLTEPLRTRDILKKLNLDEETLVLLATPKTNEESKGPEYPICRIIDRKAEEAARGEAAKNKPAKVTNKELELNWATAPNDLRTKMAQLKKFLQKGYHVEVRLMHPKRRNKRRATLEEAQQLLEAVKQAIAEVPGAKETRRMDGEVGEMVTLFLHASVTKARASAEKVPAGTAETADPEDASVNAGSS
jgi:translation initiation factor IF-3